MSAALTISLAILVFVIALAWYGFKIVPQAETMVIERLGKYNRSLASGINVIWPFLEAPRAIKWKYEITDSDGQRVIVTRESTSIDLREQVFDFPKQRVITKDNVNIEINALLYFQVTDPEKAVYEIANLPDAIEKLTQTTLRNVLGELDLDESLTSRDTINQKLRAILDEATDKWGVKVNRVELQDIIPPEDIQSQMEKQMRAERDRRAAILTAEGQKRAAILESEGIKEAEINKADGERQAAVLRAQGDAAARVQEAKAEAEAIRLVTEAIQGTSDPGTYLIAVRYISALEQMVSAENATTVYMPYEASGVLGAVGTIRNLFKETAA